MVDTLVLEASAERCASSSLVPGTKIFASQKFSSIFDFPFSAIFDFPFSREAQCHPRFDSTSLRIKINPQYLRDLNCLDVRPDFAVKSIPTHF